MLSSRVSFPVLVPVLSWCQMQPSEEWGGVHRPVLCPILVSSCESVLF